MALKQQVYTEMQTWGVVHLLASVWGCGDDHCDCSQAQIERIEPNVSAGHPWIRRETIWQGKFYTNGESGAAEDLKRHLDELVAREEIELIGGQK